MQRLPQLDSDSPWSIHWATPGYHWRRGRPGALVSTANVVCVRDIQGDDSDDPGGRRAAVQLLIDRWLDEYHAEHDAFHSTQLYCQVKLREIRAIVGKRHPVLTAVCIDLLDRITKTVRSEPSRQITNLLKNDLVLSIYTGELTSVDPRLVDLLRLRMYRSLYPRLRAQHERLTAALAERRLSSRELLEYERRKLFVIGYQTRRFEQQLCAVVFVAWKDQVQAEVRRARQMEWFVDVRQQRRLLVISRDDANARWLRWRLFAQDQGTTRAEQLAHCRDDLRVALDANLAAIDRDDEITRVAADLLARVAALTDEVGIAQATFAAKRRRLSDIPDPFDSHSTLLIRLRRLAPVTIGAFSQREADQAWAFSIKATTPLLTDDDSVELGRELLARQRFVDRICLTPWQRRLLLSQVHAPATFLRLITTWVPMIVGVDDANGSPPPLRVPDDLTAIVGDLLGQLQAVGMHLHVPVQEETNRRITCALNFVQAANDKRYRVQCSDDTAINSTVAELCRELLDRAANRQLDLSKHSRQQWEEQRFRTCVGAHLTDLDDVWDLLMTSRAPLLSVFRSYAGLSSIGSLHRMSSQEFWASARCCQLAAAPALTSSDLADLFVRVVHDGGGPTASSLSGEESLSRDIDFVQWQALLVQIAERKYRVDRRSLRRSLDKLLAVVIASTRTADNWCDFFLEVASANVSKIFARHRTWLYSLFAFYSKQSGAAAGSLSKMDFAEFQVFWMQTKLQNARINVGDLTTVFAKVGSMVVDERSVQKKCLTYPEFLQAIAALACYYGPVRGATISLGEKIEAFVVGHLKRHYSAGSAGTSS